MKLKFLPIQYPLVAFSVLLTVFAILTLAANPHYFLTIAFLVTIGLVLYISLEL